MKNLRLQGRTWTRLRHHPDFEVVQKGKENLFIVTNGYRSGDVHTDISKYDHYADFHLFIKAKDSVVIDKIVSLQEELREMSNVTSRVRSVTLCQIIDLYEKNYGRPEVLFEML